MRSRPSAARVLLALSLAMAALGTFAAWRHGVTAGLRSEAARLADGSEARGLVGHWAAPRSGRYRLRISGRAAAEVSLDGRVVLTSSPAGETEGAAGTPVRAKVELALESGVHLLAVRWAGVEAEQPRILVGFEGEALRPLDEGPLFRARPSAFVLWLIGVRHTLWIAAAFLLAGAFLLRAGLRLPQPGVLGRLTPTLRATRTHSLATFGALALVLTYGAALRLEALVSGYWGPQAPAWARGVAVAVQPLRPGSFHWPLLEDPYKGGDPGAYIRYASDGGGFYEARVREPVFVFATRLGMALAGGERVGVSLASTFFSTLLLALTFLLGCVCLLALGRPGRGAGAGRRETGDRMGCRRMA